MHTMLAAVVTASFVVAAVGAWYLLQGLHRDAARLFVRVGVIAGFLAVAFRRLPDRRPIRRRWWGATSR